MNKLFKYLGRDSILCTRSRAIAVMSYCWIPAFLYGCSSWVVPATSPREELTEISVSSRASSELSYTDIFIFNNDALRRIDSYQRATSETFKAASRSGEKILVAITNSALSSEDWRKINSYDGLLEEVSLLADEDVSHPIMSTQTNISAGSGEKCRLELERIMSKVWLRSLSADFRGTEYEGKPLTDVKVYLTNVSASCAIMKTENFNPVVMVNIGSADFNAMAEFKSKDILYQKVPSNIGETPVYADVELFCYPNDAKEETYGSPFTRLVIEGKINGETCYYPIPVNREENGVVFGGDGSGVGRNNLYVFDITLRRFGTSDPDMPVQLGDVVVRSLISPWDEKENVFITF